MRKYYNIKQDIFDCEKFYNLVKKNIGTTNILLMTYEQQQIFNIASIMSRYDDKMTIFQVKKTFKLLKEGKNDIKHDIFEYTEKKYLKNSYINANKHSINSEAFYEHVLNITKTTEISDMKLDYHKYIYLLALHLKRVGDNVDIKEAEKFDNFKYMGNEFYDIENNNFHCDIYYETLIKYFKVNVGGPKKLRKDIISFAEYLKKKYLVIPFEEVQKNKIYFFKKKRYFKRKINSISLLNLSVL